MDLTLSAQADIFLGAQISLTSQALLTAKASAIIPLKASFAYNPLMPSVPVVLYEAGEGTLIMGQLPTITGLCTGILEVSPYVKLVPTVVIPYFGSMVSCFITDLIE